MPALCVNFGWVSEDASVAEMTEAIFGMVMHVHASVLAEPRRTAAALDTFMNVTKAARRHLEHAESDFVAMNDGWRVPDFALALAAVQITYPPV